MFRAETFPALQAGMKGWLMRWLFIGVLAALMGSVLSIVWMKDKSRWPIDDRSGRATQQPADAPFLPAPAPQQPGQ